MLRPRAQRRHAQLLSPPRRIHALPKQRVSFPFFLLFPSPPLSNSLTPLHSVKEPTASILEIGVAAALKDVYWDKKNFNKRGGVYDWTRSSAVQQKEEKKKGNPEYEF